jgi:hypothetical protein
MAEKLASRANLGPVPDGERASLQQMWRTEPHTMDELISLAKEYPYQRPRQYWIDSEHGGA